MSRWRASVRRLSLLLWVRVTCLAVATFTLSLLAVHIRPPDSVTAVWWPAAAVSVGVLVLAGPRHRTPLLVTVLLATSAANLVGGRSAAVSLGFGCANAAEAWVAAWWFTRRTGGRSVFRTHEDAARLIVAGTAGAVVAGAVAAATVALLLGGDGLVAAYSVTFAHASAVLVAVPPLLLRRPAVAAPGRAVEATCQWALALFVTLAVFAPGQYLPLAFLPMPVMVWGATRLGARPSSVQVLLLGVVVSVATLLGAGPFATDATGSPGATVPIVQLFLVSYALVLTPLALAVQQRRETTARLRVSEEVFRTAFEEALVGMLVLRHVPEDEQAPLRIVRGNDVAARLLGLGVRELPGTPLCSLVPSEERHVLHRAVEGMLAHSLGAWHGELHLVVRGQERWVEMAMTRLPGTTATTVVSAQLMDITDRRATQQRLRELALHDSLTGLPNRLLLADRVEHALGGRPGDDAGALLFCDLDDFKAVNDTSGHAAGDELLIEVARRLEACVRPSDTVARLGGDEFVVFCPGLRSREAAEDVAHRIIHAVRRPIPAGGADHRVGVSVGVTLVAGGSSLDTAMREADVAMYLSKTHGKGQATHFDAAVGLGSPSSPRRVASRS